MTASPPAPPTTRAAFTAFRLRHHHPYHRYAHTRVEDRHRAAAAVEGAFDELAARWDEILRTANPARDAWRVLTAAVTAAAGSRDRAGRPLRDLARALPPEQVDALVLHYRLGMTLTTTADLIGVDAPTVALRLVLAERALPAAMIRDLERAHPA
ncbi:sigma factor-like helix-turn-helix DNA-binding protein [Embleya sp. NPDC008237]|uniref:sigma factor-like helix-turn-helix DNA-binding protein n=1 Tax=Embleya sp. NPDC008237 TaxID=3363978 RepID=UPI0036EFF09D